MGPLFSYALSVAVYLVMGYLMYKIFLAGARQQKFNRFAIYAVTMLSLLMPFAAGLATSFHSASLPKPAMATGTVDFELIPSGVIMEGSTSMVPAIVVAIYVLGMLITALWMLFSILQIVRILKKGDEVDICANGISATVTVVDDDKIAPFSWMGHIVMSRTDYEGDHLAIIEHEVGHIRNGHSYDMIGYMCLLTFQWFNPAAWLLVEELRTVHEYQADEAVIASGVNIKEYQMMLIKKAVGMRFPSPANSLNHSNLKNRITMMYKSNSRAGRKAALLMTVPAMALAMFVTDIPAVANILSDVKEASIQSVSDGKVSKNFTDVQATETEISEVTSSKEISLVAAKTAIGALTPDTSEPAMPPQETSKAQEEKQYEEKVYDAPGVLAEFPGGRLELMKFLRENIRYPKSAQDSKAQGSVIVNFVVNKDGSISNAKVLKGVSEELDTEAVRVVESMPAWKPAETYGKAVASKFTIPVTFKLESPAEEVKSVKE